MVKWICLGIGAAIVLAVGIFLIVDFAGAQTPTPYPDVPLAREGATYSFRVQGNEPLDKLMQFCCARVDGDPIELGCTAYDPTQPSSITVTLDRTPHQDAEIRCYSEDTEGNISEFSTNAAWADFTPPGRPHIK